MTSETLNVTDANGVEWHRDRFGRWSRVESRAEMAARLRAASPRFNNRTEPYANGPDSRFI